MTALEKGITANGTGYGGKTWNILGQVYFPKAVTDSTFAFETNSDPGQFVPVHICLLYTSPSPRDGLLSRMPSSA